MQLIQILKIVIPVSFVMASSAVVATTATLEELMRSALQSNPEVLAAQAARDEAMHQLRRAEWGRYPSVSVTSIESNSAPDQTISSLSLPVWTGGEIRGRIGAALAQLNEFESRIDQVVQDLFTNIVDAYVEVETSQALIDAGERNLEQHEELLARIQRRAAAQTSAQIDVQLAESRKQYAVAELIRLKADRQRAIDDLELFARILIEGVVSVPFPSLPSDQLATIIDDIERASPSIAIFESRRERAAAEFLQAEALGRFKLRAGYEFRSDYILPGQSSEQIFVAFDYAPGAGLEINDAKAAARARERAAEANIRSAVQSSANRAKAIMTMLNASHAQLGPAGELVKATKAVSESYLRQFAVGHKSWLDVVNAQREAHQAAVFQISQRKNYLTAYYRLQVMRGVYSTANFGYDVTEDDPTGVLP